MTSYCRSGIALQSISHDCPMQGRHWQCCEVIICTCWFQITNLHSFQKQLCSRSPIYWELELRREIVIQLCWKLKNFSLPIAIDICRFTASPKFHCCLLLPHILHEVQCLVARNFSLFKLITFYWRFFPISPPALLCCLFMGGLLYKFCWWPQESPSSNPNPKPLYRSWPALQISFKHLRLTFLLMNVWANISLLPSEN